MASDTLPNYYKWLGIKSTATSAEIDKAFQDKSAEFASKYGVSGIDPESHDVLAEEHSKEVRTYTEAMKALGSPISRLKYDEKLSLSETPLSSKKADEPFEKLLNRYEKKDPAKTLEEEMEEIKKEADTKGEKTEENSTEGKKVDLEKLNKELDEIENKETPKRGPSQGLPTIEELPRTKEQIYEDPLQDPTIVNLKDQALINRDRRIKNIELGKEGKDLQVRLKEDKDAVSIFVLEEESNKLWSEFIETNPEKITHTQYSQIPGITQAIERKDKKVNLENVYRPVRPREAFAGAMPVWKKESVDRLKKSYGYQKVNLTPVIDSLERKYKVGKYYEKIAFSSSERRFINYQREVGNLKRRYKPEEITFEVSKEIYAEGIRKTTFFIKPNLISNLREVEFARKYGGKAGTAEFYGVVPNGYQVENIQGSTLSERTAVVDKKWRVNGYYNYNTIDKIPLLRSLKRFDSDNKKKSLPYKNEKRQLLTKEQAQEALNLINDFQNETGVTVVFNPDKIIVQNDGRIRLDYGPSDFSGLDAKASLENISASFSKEFGYGNLQIPKTYKSAGYLKTVRETFEKKFQSTYTLNPDDPTLFQSQTNPQVAIAMDKAGGIGTEYIFSVHNVGYLTPHYYQSETFSTPKSVEYLQKNFPAPGSVAPGTISNAGLYTGSVTLSDRSMARTDLGIRGGIRQKIGGVLNKAAFAAEKGISSALNAIAPGLGSFLGRTVGNFIRDPLGEIARLGKFAIRMGTKAVGVFFAIWAYVAYQIIVGMATAFAVVLFFGLFAMFIINSGAYLVPPGGFGISSTGTESEFIRVEKIVIPTTSSNNTDFEAQYTVVVTAKKGTLNQVIFSDTCNVAGESSSSCPPAENFSANGQSYDSLEAATPPTIASSTSYTLTYTRSFNGANYNDSYVSDTFTVTANVDSGSSTASGSAGICIGDCPMGCFTIVNEPSWPGDRLANMKLAIGSLVGNHPGYVTKVCADQSTNPIELCYDPTPKGYWGCHVHHSSTPPAVCAPYGIDTTQCDIIFFNNSGSLSSVTNAEYILTHESGHHLNNINFGLYQDYIDSPANAERPYCSYDSTIYDTEGFAEAAALYDNLPSFWSNPGYCPSGTTYQGLYPNSYQFAKTSQFGE